MESRPTRKRRIPDLIENASSHEALAGPTSRGKRKHLLKETTPQTSKMAASHCTTALVADGETPLSITESSAGRLSTCSVSWPPLFKSLEQTHKALNLVYTFCCTRKHLATTFDSMKSAVEGHIKRELTIEEVAMIAALRPDSINFSYVDKLTLRLDIQSSEKEDVFKASASKRSQSLAYDASVGDWTGRAGYDQSCNNDATTALRNEILFFEFTDGDLKRQVSDRKTGEPTRPNRRLRQEALKIPVYGQKQMAQLIERRNQKFTAAVNTFVGSCLETGDDPEAVLRRRVGSFVPVPSQVKPDFLEEMANAIPIAIPKERKSIDEIVQQLKNSSWYTGQIVPDGRRVFEAQEPIYGDLEFLLSQEMVNALYNARGITQFYLHQAEALNSLHEGLNVVVSTSTNSGKSLIYQLPVLHALERDTESRAIFIFPTKALAQDQKRSLKELVKCLPGLEETLIETFDGDTPMRERNHIREEARVIFTNPDMLHVSILPQEERWRPFLLHLRYVVVDELHYYNGQLGSHVAFIMRRLRRVCAAIGNHNIQFVSCSATVANPEKHFCTIFGIDNVRLIDYDGSPTGRKEFLCWNTPFKDPGDPASGRGNAKFECARLFCALMLRGLRMIAFCRVRAQCEELVNAVKQELEHLGRPECANLVRAYRGGYTAPDRRKIEADMSEGKLLGIVATTALELGIDIGSLDCVMTWGFPYTIANLRQQSGRAGRRNRDSLSILVGDSFPTDQHYMQNPDELFTKPNCELSVDLENLLIREGHIQCAACEVPIRPDLDSKYFGQDLDEICKGRLLRDEMGFYHCHERFRPAPSRFISIRGMEEEDQFAVVDVTNGRNVVLEELEASRATFTIYDGAIFLHQGNKYIVRDFRPDLLMAKVEKAMVSWTTTQRDYTDIDPTETEAIRQISATLTSRAFFGTIKIQQNVFGYFKVDAKGRVLDAVQVDNPPIIRHSKGMWLDVPRQALEILHEHRLNAAGAIHAAEHAIMSLLPAVIISRPEEVRTECKLAMRELTGKETQRKRPARLTFYDAKGGINGSGITAQAFDHVDHLLRTALERVEGCPCGAGCLECVVSETCRDSGEVTSKAGCRVIIRSLLDLKIDVEQLPMGPQDDKTWAVQTVIEAGPVPMRHQDE